MEPDAEYLRNAAAAVIFAIVDDFPEHACCREEPVDDALPPWPAAMSKGYFRLVSRRAQRTTPDAYPCWPFEPRKRVPACRGPG